MSCACSTPAAFLPAARSPERSSNGVPAAAARQQHRLLLPPPAQTTLLAAAAVPCKAVAVRMAVRVAVQGGTIQRFGRKRLPCCGTS